MPAPRRLYPFCAAVALAVACAGNAAAQQGVTGPYLSARHAFQDRDYSNAAQYYDEVLALDPEAPLSRANALVAHLAIGEMDQAIRIAEAMHQEGAETDAASMVRLADAVERGDFSMVKNMATQGSGIGPLIDGLVTAWAHLARDDEDAAVAAFDDLEERGLQGIARYHKALALASTGAFDRAEALIAGGDNGPLHFTRRSIVAHAQILSQLGRPEAALDMIRTSYGDDAPEDIVAIRDALAAGETLAFDIVPSPTDGIAEVFFDVAGALEAEIAPEDVLLFLRVTEHLRPDHVNAMLATARLLGEIGRHALAEAAYRRVPSSHPSYAMAEIGRARVLFESGAEEAALDALAALAETRAELPSVHETMGDLLRQAEHFEDAAAAYDRALARINAPDQRHWALYYTRGICHERIGAWDQAERDLRRALELRPDQPHVLNYLGYSLVEQGEKLDEALGMIQRAVEARPDDGYIVDSMGWVKFKLGSYQEAVEYMERAIALKPTDPIINDHLGDVYWAVNRRMEARFQWRRALSFDPEPENAERIRRKLEVGLDEVMREEGDSPPGWRGANSGG